MSARKTVLMIAAILLVLLAMAGPGLAGDCPLLTKAEAEGLLGEAVKAPRTKIAKGMAAGKECVYFTAAPLAKRGGVGLVRVVVYDPATMQAHNTAFQSGKVFYTRLLKAKTNAKATLDTVDGLGDRAYWEPKPSILHVLIGDTYLTISVQPFTVLKAKSRAELDQKIAALRKPLAIKAAKEYVLPRLKAK